MSVPQSKTGWVLVIIYLVIAAYFIIQAFKCVGWVCDLIEFPMTIPFGLIYSLLLQWPNPIAQFGSIVYDPFRNWLIIVPTVTVNVFIYYWIGVRIEKLVSRFRGHKK